MNTSLINKKTTSNDTSPLITALCEPSIYEHEISTINLIETHISWVLLTGRYAYKIKKPVNFGFLDFSTLEKRLFCCQEELRLNRRLAAELYLEVVPITGQPDHPKLGGSGEAFEYAVKMIQFPAGCILSERAEHDELSSNEIDQIVEIVADFHDSIAKTGDTSPYGEPDNIKHWFVENFDHIRPLLIDDHAKQQLQVIQVWGDEEWSKK
ncbi:MAG: aminoglycoside phosphotransferase, partial [Methylococcales bacterium]|nr:aminoglycoside phosphotransferase [Methylococcales bacterium]